MIRELMQIIIILFPGGKRNGFYIESGAHDGEQFSNTLFFEVKRNYTGMTMPNE